MDTRNFYPGDYMLECTSGGGYYAYLSAHDQCYALGETEDEALENLHEAAEEYFHEITQMYFRNDIG